MTETDKTNDDRRAIRVAVARVVVGFIGGLLALSNFPGQPISASIFVIVTVLTILAIPGITRIPKAVFGGLAWVALIVVVLLGALIGFLLYRLDAPWERSNPINNVLRDIDDGDSIVPLIFEAGQPRDVVIQKLDAAGYKYSDWIRTCAEFPMNDECVYVRDGYSESYYFVGQCLAYDVWLWFEGDYLKDALGSTRVHSCSL
jgi:hypothetical protein